MLIILHMKKVLNELLKRLALIGIVRELFNACYYNR